MTIHDARRLLMWVTLFAPLTGVMMLPATAWWIAVRRGGRPWLTLGDHLGDITAMMANRMMKLDRQLFSA